MKSAEAVGALGALAHAHRLAIYRLLVQSGPEGLAAGVIAQRVGLSPSSLTFHIQSLARSGLVTQTRVSRSLVYAADYAAMNRLLGYLTENCCGTSRERAPTCPPVPARRRA